MGWIIGILVAIVIVYFLINIRAGTTGLIEANMRSYFNLRSRGLSHDEAIDGVIDSRYPSSPDRQSAIRTRLEEALKLSYRLHPERRERSEIVMLTYVIFTNESGTPPSENLTNKIQAQISDTFESVSSQYGFEATPNGAIKKKTL